jgi:hypothetical protein
LLSIHNLSKFLIAHQCHTAIFAHGLVWRNGSASTLTKLQVRVQFPSPVPYLHYDFSMKFLISVIDALENPGTVEEMVEIDKFNDQLRANSQFIFAWGLHGPEKSTVIDNRADANKSSGKPLFDARENFSGLWIIEVEDAETARSLAFAASKACNRKVELRPFH